MEMSPSPKKNDVFISFRGEDSRTRFTDHLRAALEREGIKAYIDDYLRRGEEIWPSLSQAIEDSHVAVVVFSANYANSSWCLEELVKILECRKRDGQVVIPVFYEVDPSHIRKQTGTYGEALAIHEQRLLDDKDMEGKASEWKAALAEAANISGWDTRNKHEAQVIKKIVRDVMEKLELRFPNELKSKDVVGLEKIHKDVELLLSKNKSNQLLGNVQVIGIWGMGGIGKTTVAKALFSQHFPQYDSFCFLENVREVSQNIGQSKLTSLREKMLSQLLKDEHLNSVRSTFIRSRLNSKKVLVVLDDVDKAEQIDVLCEECSYASPGSKLIITTRDRHLLRGKAYEDDIYEVKTWSFEKSLELFCLRAFKNKHPKKGYEDLSKRAVDYAGGVPLALKVLGSILYDRSAEFWDCELNKVKNYPYDGIQNVLRVSYDGLHFLEQKIFLDIAFFFKDESKDFAERILNACGFSATSGLVVLEDKALISISSGNRIQMHDLLQDVGLNMVREGTEDPGKRSRLRDVEEVSDVLEYRKKGSFAVEGIKLDLSQIDDLRLNANAFNMMTDLRFLKLYIPFGKTSGKMVYPDVLNEFFAKLRYLEWNGYHLKSLPETFCTKMLVGIRMPHSHIIELWHGVKNVENLEGIDRSECKYLKKLPDLSKASKLKWVNLSGCESLAELHASVLSLDTLETLTLDGCKKLKSLKSEKHFRSLRKVSVNDCTSLKEFAMSSQVMESLDLKNAGIEKLDSSIGRSSKLWRINLEGLRLSNLPNELSYLKGLAELNISNCRQLVLDKQNLHAIFDGLRSLQSLHLEDCCNLVELPDNINVLSKLSRLSLGRSNVKTLPASIKHMTNLEFLSIANCMKLKCLPQLPTNIIRCCAVNCTSLVTVSTLNNFATIMKGERKSIYFENCVKLNGPSRHHISEAAHLSAMNAIFQTVLKRDDHKMHDDKNLTFCSPGSSIPDQFTYRTTESPMTINLPPHSNVLGLVLCAVLSPCDYIKYHVTNVLVRYYEADGTELGSAVPREFRERVMGLKSDNVYIWYDGIHFDSTHRGYELKVTIEFFVEDDVGDCVLDNCTKECGARLIFDSDFPFLLRELDLDFDSKWKLGLELASELGLDMGLELRLELESQHRSTLMITEISDSDDEKESNDKHNQKQDQSESKDIHNQDQDLSERCYCFCDLFVAFPDYLKRMIQRETM